MKDKIYVVEGIHDEDKLKSIFKDIKTISVNGSEVSQDSIDLLNKLSKTHEIVLVLDPDHPGAKIRNFLEAELSNVKHVFFDKNDCISKNGKKVGIEHASNEVIKDRLKYEISNIISDSDITYDFLYQMKLIGNDNSKALREKVSKHFHIGITNSKTLLKRLMWLGIKTEELAEVVSKYA